MADIYEEIVNTAELHTLVAKREAAFRKFLEAQGEYQKVCDELREKINSLNKG